LSPSLSDISANGGSPSSDRMASKASHSIVSLVWQVLGWSEG
jgi:hypothetical protein